MSQETNLNINPYFDDFDKTKNYYKVLFKPGYPVQARELTTLQSILQNQIEQFGSHFFKEGARVIPGQLTYISNFYAVEINSEYSGIPVSLYLNSLEGLKIYGKTSGVKAKVVKVLSADESERGNITLYVDYYESSQNDLSQREFSDNEVLISETPIQFGNSFISVDEGFANTISTNSTSVGSAFALSNGVYFLRGNFVEVSDQILILDQYSNKPNYRVGLLVNEELITSDDDQDLTDNSQGYNNYSAPGADRLKITASLYKKDIDNYDNHSFVQLATVKNGIIREINNNSDYNIIGDELAKRTFDESGHYYVKSFATLCKESLNDGIGNDGIFNEGELTYNGSVPSQDLAIYKISSGKAYVKGYEVSFDGSTFLDAPKPRTTKLIENQAVNFNFAPTLSVNRVNGSPVIGFNTTTILSLRDERVGSNAGIASGQEIGCARVYDFSLEQGGYDVSNLDANQWDLSLFDIQTYSIANLNEPVTLNIPTFIQGESTGATGYLRNSVSGSSTITIYQINGQFSPKENISFGSSTVTNQSRYITNIRNYGITDIKSVHSTVGAGKTFSADTIQSNSYFIGIASISSMSGGISTITVNNTNISGILTSGNLIKFSQPGISTISYAKVGRVFYDTKQFEISSIQSVPGVVNGTIPTSPTSVTDLSLLITKLQSNGNSENVSGNNSLYSILPKQNIDSVDLTSSELIIRRQFDNITITSNSTNVISAGQNNTFLPFDEERYILIRSDGSLEILTTDKFEFQSGSTNLKINNLGSNDTGATLIATLKRSKITSKLKKKKVVDSIIINKSSSLSSGIGQSTANDGLVYGNYPYGTRVQDKEICLNYPDVGLLYGIFESNDTLDPKIPSASIVSMDGPSSKTSDLLIGEIIIGNISDTKALYVEKLSDTSIGFIYLNDNTFLSGETVRFNQSNVNGVISSIDPGSKNVTKNYKLIVGQTPTYYDYSKIIRNTNENVQRKLKVVFSRGYYDTSDVGDITTVNSYSLFNYNSEILKISGCRVTDIVDFRPRVSDYTVSEGNRSPFEFTGRTFNNSLHSAKDVICSDESLSLSYSYYLPRIDRIYLTKDKTFTIKYGSPSDNPTLPEEISGAMNIANVYLPAYLYDTSDAKIEFIQHKRYQMKDIFNLENRIKNLEYYTSLSMLETSTQNLFVDDGTGLNRFKSGFYVDNFTSLLTQDTSNGVKNSIDTSKGELRPSHFTSNVKLEIGNNTIPGIGDNTQLNDDKRFSSIIGSGVKRAGDTICLDYSDVSWLEQPFATRTENVTPFLVKLWEGSIQLNPTTDVWIDTNRLQVNNIDVEGSFLGIAEALRTEINTDQDGQRIGVSPVIWNSWETTGIDINFTSQSSTSSSSSLNTNSTNDFRQGTLEEFRNFRSPNAGSVPSSFLVGTETTTVDRITNTNVSTNTSLSVGANQQRTGSQYKVREVLNTETLGDRVIRRDLITYMRSRNIEFTSKRLKPFTQVYAFFDGVNVNDYCFSKLIEIEMISGAFQVGETVIGQFSTSTNNKIEVRFRVAQANHKYGPYNNPTDLFDRNPYDRNLNIPANYSSTSSVLNIDTFSLSEELNPNFYGSVKLGMRLRGLTSGSEANVKNVRLVTDRIGTLIGSFQVPNGLLGSPSFETGRSRFKLTSSSTNSQVPGVITTVAEETFYSQGEVDTTQQSTLSLRNARVEVDNGFRQENSISDSSSSTQNALFTTNVTNVSTNTRLTGEYRDPLAQSFVVDDPTGIYVTKIDLFFRTKDESLPVIVQIREVELGIPNQKILPFSEVELTPDKINISEDASVSTTFNFESPVYLSGQKEYAIVIISNSNEYNVWISRLGESDIATLGSEQNQILVTTQRLLGSLFKSQNASTWSPSQYEDLTFKIYRADFVSSGFTQFFNSDLDEKLQIMSKDPLIVESNKVKVSLSGTITNPNLSLGNTIIQTITGFATATGNLVGYAGSAFGALKVISPGFGYTGSNITYSGVALTSITGSGLNATANITINNGGVVASGATIINGGFGYVIGDILTPITIGSQNLGSGMRLSVSQINGNNQIIVDNIQGEISIGSTLRFINNSGLSTDFTNSGSPLTVSYLDTITDGEHIKVFHRNHGLHASSNKVTISNITGISTTISKLTSQYPSSSGTNNELFVSNISGFNVFENVLVSPSNPGYIRISNEILSYTGINSISNTLTGVSREIDSTKGFNYPIDTLVEKYELNGVSLRRINKTHSLSDVSGTIKESISADYYYIKVNMSTDGIDRSVNTGFGKLKFNNTSKVGGINGQATYNIPYEMIIPNIRQTSPSGTNIKSSIRTVSGTSLGGNEVSFIDKGLQDISNNTINYFDSSRVIASRINETTYLTGIPANRSINLNVNLTTSDSRISPTIDLSNNSLVLISNRVNNPIIDYKKDPRINSVKDDPNLFSYISNQIILDNPASSIKVLIDAYIHNDSDIRLLYSIGENDNTFTLFPGYGNINPDNQTVINLEDSNGSPDLKMIKQDRFIGNPSPSDFKEYVFTTNLPNSFKQFRIKLIGTSKTQSFVPIIRNLRVIALA